MACKHVSDTDACGEEYHSSQLPESVTHSLEVGQEDSFIIEYDKP